MWLQIFADFYSIAWEALKMRFLFNQVMVDCPDSMPVTEAEEYVKEQLGIMPCRKLVELDIRLDGDDVLLEPHYDSIVRVRRITGYLSTISRFNDAKKDETKSTVKHFQ